MTYFRVRKVTLKNYRSIAECSVPLGNLNFLVGPNGSGKSNFLDALRLVTDSLSTTLDHALRERGGVQEVRRRSAGHPTHFTIGLDVLFGSSSGSYSLTLGARKGGHTSSSPSSATSPRGRSAARNTRTPSRTAAW